MIASFFVFAHHSSLIFQYVQGYWELERVIFVEANLKSFWICMAFAVGKSGEYYIIGFTISYFPGKLRLKHYAESD